MASDVDEYSCVAWSPSKDVSLTVYTALSLVILFEDRLVFKLVPSISVVCSVLLFCFVFMWL